jgi:universal stress protein A
MLTKIRTILHPTDFSPASEAAFDFACSLAQEYFSEVLLLHVDEPVYAPEVEGMLLPPPPTDPVAVEKRLGHVFPLDPRVKVRRLVTVGRAADEIARVADEQKVDLIVMGTHGRRGLSRLLLGSVAEGVLRRVACPVLFVKEPRTPAAAA